MYKQCAQDESATCYAFMNCKIGNKLRYFDVNMNFSMEAWKRTGKEDWHIFIRRLSNNDGDEHMPWVCYSLEFHSRYTDRNSSSLKLEKQSVCDDGRANPKMEIAGFFLWLFGTVYWDIFASFLLTWFALCELHPLCFASFFLLIVIFRFLFCFAFSVTM